jgi:hypothetical protein
MEVEAADPRPATESPMAGRSLVLQQVEPQRAVPLPLIFQILQQAGLSTAALSLSPCVALSERARLPLGACRA